ncbi:hypothetical protein EPO05_07315 [Patescibacteria group bacterium]|nr:MAG: hypothetical protein EPO05_07315 [Patescibacteria group bacterium]
MAAGDITTDQQSIANGARLTIRPAAGVEWVVHNLYYGGAVSIHRTDGVHDLTYDTDTGAGARLGYVWHLTHGIYLELENTSGGNVVMGYDGVVTKE